METFLEDRKLLIIYQPILNEKLPNKKISCIFYSIVLLYFEIDHKLFRKRDGVDDWSSQFPDLNFNERF